MSSSSFHSMLLAIGGLGSGVGGVMSTEGTVGRAVVFDRPIDGKDARLPLALDERTSGSGEVKLLENTSFPEAIVERPFSTSPSQLDCTDRAGFSPFCPAAGVLYFFCTAGE